MQKIKLYTSPWLRLLFACLAIAIAVSIFLFSAEPPIDSADRSTGIAERILLLLFPDFKTMSVSEQAALLSAADHLLRKAAHFCVYAALGLFLCLSSLGSLAVPVIHLLRSLCIGAAYAASDEWHQAFVPGRGPGIGDVLLDSTGVLAGVLCALLLAKLIRKKKPY